MRADGMRGRGESNTFMNQKELKELIDFLIEKDISEFELERGDVKVRIKRGAEAAAPVIAHAMPIAPMPMASARRHPPILLPSGSLCGCNTRQQRQYPRKKSCMR